MRAKGERERSAKEDGVTSAIEDGVTSTRGNFQRGRRRHDNDFYGRAGILTAYRCCETRKSKNGRQSRNLMDYYHIMWYDTDVVARRYHA